MDASQNDFLNVQHNINKNHKIQITSSDIKMPNQNKYNQKIRGSTTGDITVSYSKEGQLQKQNKLLKKKNNELISQLRTFSKKLDDQLQKRNQPSSRKSLTLVKVSSQSSELKNVYKKLQIYKKQVSLLKNKQNSQKDDNIINNYQSKLKDFIKQNQQLKEEIKLLKKVIKKQQKGLTENGATGYLKTCQENQKNKEVIRKLRLQIDQFQRKQRANSVSNIVVKKQDKIQRSIGSKKYEGRHKKVNSSFRMRTQPLEIQNRSQTHIDKNPIQKDKMQKFNQKIKSLMFEKDRQRQIIQNLKIQINQKDQQILYFKDKIQNFRRLNRNKKAQKQKSIIIQQVDQNKDSMLLKDQQRHLSVIDNSNSNKSQLKLMIQKNSENSQSNKIQVKGRYPRLQQFGQQSLSHLKWNDHIYSSKILEIKVFISDSLPTISHLLICYQKGKPLHPQQLKNTPYKSLILQQNQLIISIGGGFFNGFLEYLVVITNKARTQEFGNLGLKDKAQRFFWEMNKGEMPVAIFGQYHNKGVKRLGCFIDRIF